MEEYREGASAPDTDGTQASFRQPEPEERPIAVEIMAEAKCADLADHDGWFEMSQVQRTAAVELARLLHPARVDTVMHLPSGTVENWYRNERSFRCLVLDRRWEMEKKAPPRVDYAAALSPRQSKAADLLAEGRTQKETADEIGFNVRTVRNWQRDPAFQQYRDQRHQKFQSDRRTKDALAEGADQAQMHELRALAIEVLTAELELGGVDSALTILKLLLHREGK